MLSIFARTQSIFSKPIFPTSFKVLIRVLYTGKPHNISNACWARKDSDKGRQSCGNVQILTNTKLTLRFCYNLGLIFFRDPYKATLGWAKSGGRVPQVRSLKHWPLQSANFLLRVLDPIALLGILGKQLVFAPQLHETGAGPQWRHIEESKLEAQAGASTYIMEINYKTYTLLLGII